MGALITDGDIAFLVSEYPNMDIERPTGQQEQLLLNYFRGCPIEVAARNAGYRSALPARRYLKSDAAKVVLEYLREREFTDVRINRDSLTGMFLQAYHEAGTAMEKIAATRELGKLHGIYPDAKKAAAEAEIAQNLADLSSNKLKTLSNEKLLELSGRALDALTNTTTIEGEAKVVS